ncbi:putative outer membrane protein [Sulfitobacter noctilucicola]|uniref:Translocation and assembly module TamA n=1 Tax=Sulfitobacter noctilucicola TaxID=1342301 RepID=A0A7W6MC49_9RHOB|nr:autotransporter assembly complex family protein [Sulfitobacter noctilucicola]KIN64163.1 putative outer membrane protein [Sulfitobacter noctilucicola]MBB4175517.1 translocation and assembly module TamA [Sulfitobacter noctilucicola]
MRVTKEQTVLRLLGRVLGGAGLTCLASLTLAAEVRITGIDNDSDLYDTVAGGSLLIEQTSEELTPTTQEVVAAAQADYGRLLAVLYDQGYFGPVITITLDGTDAAAIPPVQPPRSINQAVINISTGPKFRFGTAKIAPVAPGTEIPEEFAGGQTASLSVLKDAVSEGIDGWRAQGYAKAALSSQTLTARHADQIINADLVLAPGPKLRFGRLQISGNEDVREDRIRDIAGLPEGEVFSPEELRLAATRLRRTGAFSSVALLEAEQIGPDATLPITAQITENAPRRFGFGAELGSLEGLTLSAFWMHRNLLGGAERLRIEGEIKGIGGNSGGEDYSLSARFERPATFNEDTDFYALAEIEQLDEVNYFSRQLDLEAGIERYASEERTYTLGVGLRRAETRDVFGENRYTLLTLPLSATFDYRDNTLDAKNGYYIDASVMPFLAVSGSDNGMRSLIDARAYRTFGEARPVTLALRGQVGSVYGPDISTAPADYLFYSGGGGTVRGQPYQSLGVDQGSGDLSGGRSFVSVSAEARFSVTDTIGVVGFVDGGYIGSEEFYDGSGEWHSGAGVGLRYNTGIGPIRLDVAVPTSGPETDENFQVYIGIGQSF